MALTRLTVQKPLLRLGDLDVQTLTYEFYNLHGPTAKVCNKKAQSQTVTLTFNPPFLKAPAVSYAVTLLDMKNNAHLRYRTTIDKLTSKDLTFEFHTWEDTIIYKAVVTFWVMGILNET